MNTLAGGFIVRSGDVGDIGAKAAALAALERSDTGIMIPPWFAISPRAHTEGVDLHASPELRAAVASIARNEDLLAVRSSSIEEDSTEHAFAGQFDSYLGVKPEHVADRIADVWHSAFSERVEGYRREHALPTGTTVPAVLVQRMVNADAAGVAFSADPVDGRRGIVVIAATYGLGTSVVSGDQDADSYRVNRTGEIIARNIARKQIAERACSDGGTVHVPVADASGLAPALSDDQVCDIAALARVAESHFGRPQDIEWCIERDVVYLLQSRPITSLRNVPDPDAPLCIWDNSNITESYSGVTTPLTYSFARYVYEEVYRQFCRLLGVSEVQIEGNTDAFRSMVGLVRGRMYYNLVSWYSTLALLPGFSVNRKFMEQMMGVKEPLPNEVTERFTSKGPSRVLEMLRLLRSVSGLVRAHWMLPVTSRTFHRRLCEALDQPTDLTSMRTDELMEHYRQLERKLLRHWDAPLVNDFFAMVFFGVLGKLCVAWCADTTGNMQSALVAGGGGVVSVEPVRRMREMAEMVAGDHSLTLELCNGDVTDALRALRSNQQMRVHFDDFIAIFGDRCIGELKLESETHAGRPDVLLRSIGRMALTIRESSTSSDNSHGTDGQPKIGTDVRAAAETSCRAQLNGHPIRRTIFDYVLGQARSRIRDRENLRFERTRVFGRVRRIFAELGKRFAADGLLDDLRDIFYLEVNEIFGILDGTTSTTDLRGLAALRRNQFNEYATTPAPPDRFESRGSTRVITHTMRRGEHTDPTGGEVRKGTGCYPGVVRGPVRVVYDPTSAALLPGEIMVAERTDPGWVVLFPCAAALAVERGSLLSHSAIVARELGIPAIVAVEGLTSWLSTGDVVELDGSAGTISRLTLHAPGMERSGAK